MTTGGESDILVNVLRIKAEYWPVVVHDGYEQADLVNVLRRNVKHNGLIVDRVQSVPLCWRLPLLQPPALTHQGHFHIRIWERKCCVTTLGLIGMEETYLQRVLVWEYLPLSELTWSSRDVHGFEISGFDHGDGEPAGRGEVTQWEHQLSQVHILLEGNMIYNWITTGHFYLH